MEQEEYLNLPIKGYFLDKKSLQLKGSDHLHKAGLIF